MPAAALLMRLTSQLMHLTCGTMAVFCLYQAATVSNYDTVNYCFESGVLYGGVACAILYFQGKYLSHV
jgi:hypothetical protein